MDIRGCPDRTWQLQKYSGPIVKHLHFKGGQLEGGAELCGRGEGDNLLPETGGSSLRLQDARWDLLWGSCRGGRIF